MHRQRLIKALDDLESRVLTIADEVRDLEPLTAEWLLDIAAEIRVESKLVQGPWESAT